MRGRSDVGHPSPACAEMQGHHPHASRTLEHNPPRSIPSFPPLPHKQQPRGPTSGCRPQSAAQGRGSGCCLSGRGPRAARGWLGPRIAGTTRKTGAARRARSAWPPASPSRRATAVAGRVLEEGKREPGRGAQPGMVAGGSGAQGRRARHSPICPLMAWRRRRPPPRRGSARGTMHFSALETLAMPHPPGVSAPVPRCHMAEGSRGPYSTTWAFTR